jgi:hypothetical protein
VGGRWTELHSYGFHPYLLLGALARLGYNHGRHRPPPSGILSPMGLDRTWLATVQLIGSGGNKMGPAYRTNPYRFRRPFQLPFGFGLDRTGPAAVPLIGGFGHKLVSMHNIYML